MIVATSGPTRWKIERHLAALAIDTEAVGTVAAAMPRLEVSAWATRPCDWLIVDLDAASKDASALVRKCELLISRPGLVAYGGQLDAETLCALQRYCFLLTRPFEDRHLVAALRATRRVVAPDGPLVVDHERMDVVVEGSPCGLTRDQFALFRLLSDRWPAIVTVDEIRATVFGGAVSDTTVRSLVCRMRERLGAAAPCVVNARGKGYAFARDWRAEPRLPTR